MSLDMLDDLDDARRRRAPRWVPAVAAVALVLSAFVAVRYLRMAGQEEVTRPTATAPGMPTSAAVEDRYGVRFDAVVLTGDGGIIELRYTVLDQAKADQLHETQPWLGLPNGTKLDQPGIAGHGGHGKNSPQAGRAGYLLLANSGHAVRTGTIVTVHVGDAELRGVPVQG